MQVMPFWTRVIGDGDAGKLFHMQTNLRFGCVILRHYIDRERGDLFMALGRYNGSRGKPQYPNAVLGASRIWDFQAAAAGRENARPDPAVGQSCRAARTRATPPLWLRPGRLSAGQAGYHRCCTASSPRYAASAASSVLAHILL